MSKVISLLLLSVGLSLASILWLRVYDCGFISIGQCGVLAGFPFPIRQVVLDNPFDQDAFAGMVYSKDYFAPTTLAHQKGCIMGTG